MIFMNHTYAFLSIVNPLSGTFSETGGKLLEELVGSHSKGCKIYAYFKRRTDFSPRGNAAKICLINDQYGGPTLEKILYMELTRNQMH